MVEGASLLSPVQETDARIVIRRNRQDPRRPGLPKEEPCPCHP
jgi:hypothetical protein